MRAATPAAVSGDGGQQLSAVPAAARGRVGQRTGLYRRPRAHSLLTALPHATGPTYRRSSGTLGGAPKKASTVRGQSGGDGARPPVWHDLLGDRLWAPPASDLHLRPIRDDEWPEVADIQAESFHTPIKFGLMNAVAYNSFRAEIRANLSQKLKYSNPESFCCLVAERKENSKLVGVVEVSVLQDKDVLGRLDSAADSYAYIACMAVSPTERRTGVATALLAAAEQVAVRWDQKVAVLDVYEDNASAYRLYEKNGYESKNFDPSWVKMVGRRQRLHMEKQIV